MMRILRKYGPWYILGAFALAAGCVWSAVFWVQAQEGLLRLFVFDVGQGDAIFIAAPGGGQVLIDGGPDSTVLTRLGEVMPFWDRSIDAVILTHPHADHLDGLIAVLERYGVGVVVESGVEHSIAEYEVWRRKIRELGIPRIVAVRGGIMRLGGGARLDVLLPDRPYDARRVRNIHEAAIVLKLSFASTTALLMADAELSRERELLASGINIHADLLKVGHHGSKTSTSEVFLRAVRPRLAAISVGAKNRYGHPAGEVLDRLQAAGVEIFRTDRDGTVTFISDGTQFRAATLVVSVRGFR